MPLKQQTSPLRQKLGIELRRLREAAGMSADQAASELEISASTISRAETGAVQPHPRDVDAMCQLYGVKDDRKREAVVALARQSRQRGWWYKHRKELSDELLNYVVVESGAATISSFQTMILPGALQTPEYTKVLSDVLVSTESPETVEQHIELRAKRQQELFSGDKRSVHIILDEQVLTRPIGTPSMRRDQLELLLEVSEADPVTLQVVPISAGAYAGLGGSFTLFGFAPPIELDIVHVENHARNYMVESEDTIRYYEVVFQRVQKAALPVPDTRALVKQIAEGL